MAHVPAGEGGRAEALIAPLRADPARSAVLSDVDGVLAPIAERPEQAAVPPEASAVLAELSGRYGLVGCISGRRAARARELVGLDGITYAGNHGLELLLPGEEGPRSDHVSPAAAAMAARFLDAESGDRLREAGLRREDKGPIQALHWRGAADEEAAEAAARELASRAERDGLRTHWGRKVLELRPPVAIGKDIAVSALLDHADVTGAIYAGDDRTDLDAFRRLRELRSEGRLTTAVCVGVVSEEGPAEISTEADAAVPGPAGWLDVLHALAG